MAKDKNLKKMKKLKKEVNKTYKEWQKIKPEISTFMDEINESHQSFEETLQKIHDYTKQI